MGRKYVPAFFYPQRWHKHKSIKLVTYIYITCEGFLLFLLEFCLDEQMLCQNLFKWIIRNNW